MNSYRDAPALRRSLETRLKQESERNGTDLGRLRRRVVFERIAVRLGADSEQGWVLKGGAVLEFRLADRARATKDLDVAVRAEPAPERSVRDLLIETLLDDPDEDRFSFAVSEPSPLSADSAGRPAWRFTVQADLAGKVFAKVRLDVVARDAELDAVERIRLPGMLAFAQAPAREAVVVARRQHFAEKLHALTRDYGDRPNTRTKDLVDLILLIDTGLIADHALVETTRHVFRVRETHPVPERLPALPPQWEAGYAELARELAVPVGELDGALELLRSFWRNALSNHENPNGHEDTEG